MGLILGRLRKRKTTTELLEKLENQIKDIEEFSRDTELRYRKLTGRFIFFSIGLYLLVSITLFYFWKPAKLTERLKCFVPLAFVPFLIYIFKRLLSWYYDRELLKNQTKLKTLKDEKKKVLDEVMEKETYKVAKEILEKYGPEQIKKQPLGNELTPMRGVQRGPSTPGLRLRNVPQASQGNKPYGVTFGVTPVPSLPPVQTGLSPKTPMPVSTAKSAMVLAATPGRLPLPRAILPKNRSVLNKMVEYLLGDGPSNRYALICKNCSGHNGMALKEEFEYLSFKCCYCYALNPARKKRPVAPQLEFGRSTPPITGIDSDSSDSDKMSPPDTESEREDDKTDGVKIEEIFTTNEAEPADATSSTEVINSDQPTTEPNADDIAENKPEATEISARKSLNPFENSD